MIKNVINNVVQYKTKVITFKTTHSNSFLKGTMKTKIFLQQVDNKIENITKTSDERIIRYVTLLLQKTTME